MELPIFNAIISDKNDGVYAVSLVDCPATEVDWIAFNKEQEKLEFSFDETKHCLTAPLMLADTLIYRRNGDYEYYIKYEPETLRVMAEKMLADNTFNEIDFQHDGKIIEKGLVNLIELYIKDETKPSPFNVPDGSIICTYKINDESIWESVTNGTFNGFSLAGYFGLEEVKCNKNTEESKNIKNTFMNILETLKQLVVDIEAAEQKPTPEEEKEKPEVETETPEEKPEEEKHEDENPVETPEETPEDNKDLDEIKAKIEGIETTIADLMTRLEAIETALKETETPIEETPAEEIVEDKFSRLAKLFNKE